VIAIRSVNVESVSAAPAWVSPQPLPERERQLLIFEIIAVFAVSLGASGVRSLVSLIGSLTAPQALRAQHVVMNGSQAPGRPWFDLSLQLVSIASGGGARAAGVLPAGQERRAALAHTLINSVAFVGYTLLAAHVSWLP
jgi:hypothetical protein